MIDVIVVGAGPAGVFAARRAAELGARTALITREEYGGMTANDGPVPVRALALAARPLRQARQLGQYGIAVSEPVLARVRDVVTDLRTRSVPREYLDGRLVAFIKFGARVASVLRRRSQPQRR